MSLTTLQTIYYQTKAITNVSHRFGFVSREPWERGTMYAGGNDRNVSVRLKKHKEHAHRRQKQLNRSLKKTCVTIGAVLYLKCIKVLKKIAWTEEYNFKENLSLNLTALFHSRALLRLIIVKQIFLTPRDEFITSGKPSFGIVLNIPCQLRPPRFVISHNKSLTSLFRPSLRHGKPRQVSNWDYAEQRKFKMLFENVADSYACFPIVSGIHQ